MNEAPQGARTAPATARNREPILAVLREELPAGGTVLEIAAGSGEHAAFFAAAFPSLRWLPTDPDEAAQASIAAWRSVAGTDNLAAPERLDASEPEAWRVQGADAIVCINMVHISPWAATEGLMAGAARLLLPPGGLVYLYGPYVRPGVETAPSNLAFDASLKARNPAWGLRSVEDVATLARTHGLTLRRIVEMPANNLSLVFRKAEARTA